MLPVTGEVMSGQFSGSLQQVDRLFPPRLEQLLTSTEREEGGWQPLLAQGASVTFDPPVEVSLPSSQLCLPRPSSSYSSLFLLKHKTLAVCSLSPLTLYKYSLGILRLQGYLLMMQQELVICSRKNGNDWLVCSYQIMFILLSLIVYFQPFLEK